MRDEVVSAYEAKIEELRQENKQLAAALKDATRRISVHENCMAAIESAVKVAKWSVTK